MSLLTQLAHARQGLAMHHQKVIDHLLVHDGVGVAIAYAKSAPR